MGRYRYKALDRNFKNTSGVIVEDGIAEAASLLKTKGLTIIDLKEEEDTEITLKEEKEESKPQSRDFFSFISTAQKIMLLKQMTYLISAGISVVPALEIVEKQTKKKKVKKILCSIRNEVESGKALSEAMSKFPRVFSNMITNVIKTGEETGLIDDSLRQVVTHIEKKSAMKKRIIISMIYPTIVLLVSIGSVFFMALKAIPELIPLIQATGGEVPWNTQMIIDFSNYFVENYKRITLFIGATIAIVVIGLSFEKGKYYIDKFKIRIPIVGGVFHYSSIVDFTSTLAILLESGVPIVQALRNTGEATGNLDIKRKINKMADSVLEGENLSEPITREGSFFPPMVGSMIKVGEETGSIDNSLKTLTDMFEEMLENRIKTMNALIEPFLILFIGIVVGFVVWGAMAGLISSYGV